MYYQKKMAKENGTRKFVIAFLTFWMYAAENGQIQKIISDKVDC